MRLRNIIILTKLCFKGTAGTLQNNESKLSKVLSWGGISLIFLALVSQLFYLYYSICEASNTGFQKLFEVAIFFVIIFSVFVSIPALLSNMYQQRDVLMFKYLPVKDYELAMARLNVCLIKVLPFSFISGIPALIVSGFFGALSWVQLLMGLILLIVMPAFVLGVLGIIIFAILQFEKFVTYKGIVSALLSLILYIGIFFWVIAIQTSVFPLLLQGDPKYLNKLINSINRYSGDLYLYTPFNAIFSSYDSSVFFYLGVVTILTVLIYMIVAELYSSAYISINNSAQFNSNAIVQQKLLTPASIRVWLLRREWWILKDNSFSVAQLVQGVLIPPIATGITAFTTLFALGVKTQETAYKMMDSFGHLDIAILNLLVAMATINVITPTSISREGKYFYVSKSIPINYSEQFIVKYLCNMVITTLSLGLSFLVVVVALIPMKHPFGMIAIAFMMTVFINIVSTFMDLHKPVLNWSHPQQALNGNSNTSNQIFLVIATMIAYTTIYKLLSLNRVNDIYIYACLLVLTLLMSTIILVVLKRKINLFYERINI